MISIDPFARRTARRACALVTVVAVSACGSGSDGSSSGAVTKSESVQSFTGTVSCDVIGGQPLSRAFETRVVFDRAVHRSMSQEVSGAAAIQVGGLAGSVVKGARSQVSATIRPPSMFAGPAIDFKVAANPASGTYAETGSWTIGVDANGKATLKGDSTALLGPVAAGWRAACRWDLAEAQAPIGPIPYGHLEQSLTPPATGGIALGNSCGAGVFAGVTDGLYVGAALTGFIGLEGWTLALSVAAVGSTVGSQTAGLLCPTSSADSMNQQLQVLSAEIQKIDSYLGLGTNVLYYGWYQLQVQNAESSRVLWENAVNGISNQPGADGLFGQWMGGAGLGLWNQNNVSNGTSADPTQLALNDTVFSQAKDLVDNNLSKFQDDLKQLSGTDVIVPVQSTCTPDCSAYVVQASDSALINLYRDLFSALQANIDLYAPQAQAFNAVANQNVVQLYDQYNAMLVKFWTQAATALQQAYTMDTQVNQLNYFRATNSTDKTQIKVTWSGIAGTLYQYAGKTLEVETNAYNTAQTNLAKAYAARMNQLYLNTLNYIVSDVPVAPQAYPGGSFNYTVKGKGYSEPPIDYAGQVGKNIAASTNGSQGRTPLSLVPAVADGTWQSAAVLYQFSGMKDAATCFSNAQAYNASAGSSGTLQGWLQKPVAPGTTYGQCPSIFALNPKVAAGSVCPPYAVPVTYTDGTQTCTTPLSYNCDQASPPNCTGSVYDGNTLQPYSSFSTAGSTGNPMQLTKAVPNNLKFCDPEGPALAWDPRGPMLNCGKWYVPQYQAKGFPRANVPAANNDSGFYGSAYYSSNLVANGDVQGCSNNLSFEGARYPLLTSLVGSWPSGVPSSCAAVIPQVPFTPTSGVASPVVTNTRLIDGNFDTGDQTKGCTIGYIGIDSNDKLSSNSALTWVQLLLRLPRAMDAGNESGGFALPLQVSAVCDPRQNNLATEYDYAQMYVAVNSFYNGDINVAGYQCTGQLPGPMTCTIADGTKYTISAMRGGNGYKLNVQVTP